MYNANRLKTPDGDLNDIRGHAFTTDEPGKLIVDLFGGSGLAPCEFTIVFVNIMLMKTFVGNLNMNNDAFLTLATFCFILK